MSVPDIRRNLALVAQEGRYYLLAAHAVVEEEVVGLFDLTPHHRGLAQTCSAQSQGRGSTWDVTLGPFPLDKSSSTSSVSTRFRGVLTPVGTHACRLSSAPDFAHQRNATDDADAGRPESLALEALCLACGCAAASPATVS